MTSTSRLSSFCLAFLGAIGLMAVTPGNAQACPDDFFIGGAFGPAVVVGSTVGAGNDFSPTCGLSSSNQDVSAIWIPVTSGVHRVDLAGSTYDTVLAIQDGSSCPGTQLACNDDFPGLGLRSAIDFNAVAGTPYRIVITGFGSSTGNFQLNITPPAAPQCPDGDLGSATGFGVASGTTVGGGNDVDPGCGASNAPDQSYDWTAPSGGTFQFDTDGSSYDTVLSLHDSCSSPSLACDDDESPFGLRSALCRNVSAGQQLLVNVDGFSSASGSFTLNINSCPDADGDGYAAGGPGCEVCGTDCDDGDPSVNPGASEIVCDGVDNDCNSFTSDAPDADGDGFSVCDGDCDDNNANTFPGAEEICDLQDNDCDGSLGPNEIDDDGDGFSECDGDCDDVDPAVFPGAEEVCNFIDDDCDGLVDEAGGGTFASSDVPKRIPPGTSSAGTTQSTLSVGSGGAISDVNVTLDIVHTFDADLDIFLRHDDTGTVVELTTDNGSFGNNFTGTTFDDEASTAIAGLGSSAAPFSGSFQPEGSLSDFDGEDQAGTWTLIITDDAFGDIGELLSWSIEFGGVEDSDGDGVGELCDLCADTSIPEAVPTRRLLPNHYALTEPCVGDEVSISGSSSPGLRIPSGTSSSGQTTDTITITDSGNIADVNVTIDITHTFDGDLDIFLIHDASGTRVELTSDNGSFGDNYTNTTFDDEAATPIAGLGSSAAPFTGSFQPEGSLSDFDGLDAASGWTLEVNDDAFGDIGTLNSWSLDITAQEDSSDTCRTFTCGSTPSGDGGSCTTYTVEDTLGCSCDQIIDELGLGNGHRFHGCSPSAMQDWTALIGG